MNAAKKGEITGESDLSPEMRNVFDRLLATEEEIQEARARGPRNVLGELGKNAGISAEQRQAYAEALQRGNDRFAAIIAARRLVEQRKMEKVFTEAAKRNVDRDIMYRTIADIREQGGINLESLLAEVDEGLVEMLSDKWKEPFVKGMIKKNGTLSAMEAADLFNQESVANLAGMLLSLPTRAH